MKRIVFVSGSVIDLVESTENIRGISSKPSMYCFQCDCYTKKYDSTGYHICGNEVIGGYHDVDLDFEGHLE